MKRIHYFFLIVCLWIVFPVLADNNNPYPLTLVESQVQKVGNTLQMEFVLDYRNLTIPSNDQLLVSPVIIGAQDTLGLSYLLFPGKTRDKVNHRKLRLYGNETVFPEPYATLYPSGKPDDIVVYRAELPFESWMYGARVELQQDIYGCADCHRVLSTLPIDYIPNPPKVAFITPITDSIREERITLHIDFPWDQAVILPKFSDNATELSKIDSSLQRIISERMGKIQRIGLTGYASPEGTYAYNSRLAGQRVQAVKNYILQKYPETERIFVIDTVPENWQGVIEWADSSDLRYRNRVLDIITHTADPDARDKQIRQLDGNATYRRLLQESYPYLRKVEYVVNYKVQPLTVGESEQIYKTYPQKLTPYELYTLSRSYPDQSPEFYDIIYSTVRFYPRDPIANNNAAAAALQQEDPETARAYLLKCSDTPQSLNNQGVLLWLEGKIPEACECFEYAKEGGCNEAAFNLSNLEQARLIP